MHRACPGLQRFLLTFTAVTCPIWHKFPALVDIPIIIAARCSEFVVTTNLTTVLSRV